MRICSLLPSATEVVAGLGLVNELVAISHECDYPPEIRTKPVAIRSVIDPERSSSSEIENHVRAVLKSGDGVYRIDDRLLLETSPQLIITQDLCEVCAVTPTEVQRALAALPETPQILSLNPTRLEEVFQDIEKIGARTGRLDAARQWVARLRERMTQVRTRLASVVPRRVACLEWLEPLYSAGHWVPELVSLAGGTDVLTTIGTKSAMVSWEHVRNAMPDVVVLMPCGFSIERTQRELQCITSRDGWAKLPAVRHSEVYMVDGPAFFNRPGPRLVDGLELLARLLHPDRFDGALPAGARRIS